MCRHQTIRSMSTGGRPFRNNIFTFRRLYQTRIIGCKFLDGVIRVSRGSRRCKKKCSIEEGIKGETKKNKKNCQDGDSSISYEERCKSSGILRLTTLHVSYSPSGPPSLVSPSLLRQYVHSFVECAWIKLVLQCTCGKSDLEGPIRQLLLASA